MKESGLVVFGAGQMRTGTSSLKLALEQLLEGKCYHMSELFRYHKGHVYLWNSCFEQGMLNNKMCDEIFDGYCASVDYPAAPFYKDLMKIYPNAKVILTTRESNSWVKSVRNTTLVSSGIFSILQNFIFYFNGFTLFRKFFNNMMLHTFHVSKNELEKSDDLLKEVFERYNEEVINHVPKYRLLIFNISDGWEPLCEFLNLPVPDVPFPHVNTTDEFQGRVTKLRNIAIMKSGLVLAVLAVSGAILTKWYIGV